MGNLRDKPFFKRDEISPEKLEPNTLISMLIHIQVNKASQGNAIPNQVWKMLPFNEDELLCLTKDSIEVYHQSSLQYVRTFAKGFSESAWSMAVIASHVLVATEKRGLIQYDLNGRRIKCLNSEPHKDVTAVGDRVVALRMFEEHPVNDGNTSPSFNDPCAVYIDHYNKHLRRTDQVKVDTQLNGNDYLTSAIIDDLMYICSASQCCIYQVDVHSGVILQTSVCDHKPRYLPLYGLSICWAEGDIILLADSHYHQWQVYDCLKHVFQAFNIEGLRNPRAAVVDGNGRLFVAGWHANSLARFA